MKSNMRYLVPSLCIIGATVSAIFGQPWIAVSLVMASVIISEKGDRYL